MFFFVIHLCTRRNQTNFQGLDDESPPHPFCKVCGSRKLAYTDRPAILILGRDLCAHICDSLGEMACSQGPGALPGSLCFDLWWKREPI